MGSLGGFAVVTVTHTSGNRSPCLILPRHVRAQAWLWSTDQPLILFLQCTPPASCAIVASTCLSKQLTKKLHSFQKTRKAVFKELLSRAPLHLQQVGVVHWEYTSQSPAACHDTWKSQQLMEGKSWSSSLSSTLRLPSLKHPAVHLLTSTSSYIEPQSR